MAQHGYLGEGYGSHGDVGDDRDWRSESDWDRERGARRSLMSDERSGSWRDGESSRDRSDWRSRDRDDDDDDRGFFERARSWFGDDDDDRSRETRGNWSRRESYGPSLRGGSPRGGMGAPERERGQFGRSRGYASSQGDFSRGGRGQGGVGGSGDWPQRDRQNFSSHQDDHYRSWRDRQMQSLDRDYQDYCREREQQFHQDFDSWRQNRQSQGRIAGDSGELTLGQSDIATRGGTTTGMTSETAGSQEGGGDIAQTSASPESTATLGEGSPSTRSGRSRS